MTKRLYSLTIATVGLLVLPVLAQESEGPPRGPRDPQMRQRMLEEFDADGNGQLSDEERQTMRETMRERFGRRGPRDPERRQRMLEEFDADGNGQLSDEERQTMRETMRERFGRRGPREAGRADRPAGAEEGSADRETEATQDADAPERPQRAERRGRRVPPGPEGRRRGPGRADRDARQRGRARQMPPVGPDMLFTLFDANGNNVLDREEFRALAGALDRLHNQSADRPRRRGNDGDRIAPRRGRPGPRGPQDRPGPRPRRPLPDQSSDEGVST